MYVGLKQPRGYGERYVTPALAAAKETIGFSDLYANNFFIHVFASNLFCPFRS